MVTIAKIGNDKIKIDGKEIGIKDYNDRFGWYKDDEWDIRKEYKKLAAEIFIDHSKANPNSPTGYYETEDYLKEKEKVLKVNRNAYYEAEKIEKEIGEITERVDKIGSKAIYGKDSFDDNEKTIERFVEFNNGVIEKQLELYKRILPKLRQAFTQKEKTGNSWGNDYNDPNKDKSREELGQRANEIETYRNKVKGEIESVLNQDPKITNEDLETDNQGWVNEIWNSHIALGEKEIDIIKERVLTDISIKRTAKKSKNDSDRNQYDNLIDETKDKALKKITAALQSAWLSQSDLSADCQNWREQIDLAVKEESVVKIEDIEKKLLADINNRKEQNKKNEKGEDEKAAQELANKTLGEIDKMEDDKLAESLALFTRWEGENEKFKASEVLEEAKRVLKERNPALYREKNIEAIRQRISDYGMDEKGLSELTRELISGEITDLGKFDETILKAIQEVGQEGAKSKWTSLFSQAQELLKKAQKQVTEKIKEDIKAIQEQMKNLKSHSNSYLTSYYQKEKANVEKLEKQLSNSLIANQKTTPPKKTPWGAIIPLSLVAVAVVAGIAVVIVRKRKQQKIKK